MMIIISASDLGQYLLHFFHYSATYIVTLSTIYLYITIKITFMYNLSSLISFFPYLFLVCDVICLIDCSYFKMSGFSFYPHFYTEQNICKYSILSQIDLANAILASSSQICIGEQIKYNKNKTNN